MQELNLNQLKYKEPLIYRISNKYYYIGAGVFEECTADEIALYEQLVEEYRKLSKLTSDFSKLLEHDVDALSACYEKILGKYDGVYFDGKEKQMASKINEFIFYLTSAEKEELGEQMDCYRSIMNLSDRCFYREMKNDSQKKEELK